MVEIEMPLITLISPPWYYHKDAQPRPSHNLGLGYVAGILESRGFKVEIIDALLEGIDRSVIEDVQGVSVKRVGLPYEEIVSRINPSSSHIGVTIPFTMLADISHQLTRKIKNAYPDTPLILGGVYPSTLPEMALSECVDYAVVGEGEIPMLELVQGRRPEDIKGLVYRRNGEVVTNGATAWIEDLDSIPYPARHLIPFDRYTVHSPRGQRHRKVASLITSRGCPFDCTFCSVHPIFGYRWRSRSVDNIMGEIEELQDKYGVSHIEFEDDNLTLNRERAVDLFQAIIKHNTDRPEKSITWSCNNGIRIDTLDRTLIRSMKDSGCEWLGLGLESGDRDILKAMNKKLDLDKVEEVVRIGAEVGIRMSAFMIVGYPGETDKRFKNSLNFFLKLKKLGVEYFPIHIINVYPNTRLHQICLEKGYLVRDDLTSVRNMVVGVERLQRMNVDLVTDDFGVEDVLKRREKAYRKLMPADYYLEKYSTIRHLLKSVLPERLGRWALEKFRKHM
jgi:magnesium-protoporphyrin IX monomethyl ester (oxidative) cyclase